MSEGASWSALFSQVERVYVDCAALLREADTMLDQAGYVRAGTDNNVGMQTSMSPSKPAWWFPGWLSRHYHPATGAHPRPMLAVAVLLHNRGGDDMGALSEPVVSGAIWRFREPTGAWRYWMAKAWCWGTMTTDGSPTRRDVRGGGVSAEARVFAVPLREIPDAEALKARVISPLLELSKEAF